jgi:hypothetical protein
MPTTTSSSDPAMSHAKHRLRHVGAAVLCCITQLSMASADLAFTSSASIRAGGTQFADHQVIARTAPGTYQLDVTALTALLPSNAAIDAISYMSSTRVYFSLDRDVRIGGNYFADHDVILWDGVAFSLAWDGAASGLPRRCNVDALDVISESPLVFSFSLSETASLPGPGEVHDHDIIRWNGSGFSPTLDFRGSDFGIPARANLNAFNRRLPDQWLMSFDSTIRLGPLTLNDGDIVSFNPLTQAFGSAHFVAAVEGFPPTTDVSAIEATPGQVPVTLSGYEVE